VVHCPRFDCRGRLERIEKGDLVQSRASTRDDFALRNLMFNREQVECSNSFFISSHFLCLLIYGLEDVVFCANSHSLPAHRTVGFTAREFC
jgi:hypothetical protein